VTVMTRWRGVARWRDDINIETMAKKKRAAKRGAAYQRSIDINNGSK